MDYDRIMVLDKGELREYDKPDELLKVTKSRVWGVSIIYFQNTESIFYGMVKDAGLLTESTESHSKM